MIMERKVGEIFEYNGEWYQCVECDSCGKCSLRTTECGSGTKSDIADEVFGECSKVRRTDNKHAIFKKLEKVGEPIRIENKSYQKIKVPDALCNNCAFYDNFSRDCKLNGYINPYPTYSCLINEMFVEIKQTKEDMEEKKLNLKEFDLEAAKQGKPVCTRDGRKARIICFDAKDNKPIVALIYDCKKEIVLQYLENGRSFVDEISNYDLMMLPEKKEGWLNIYKNFEDTVCCVYPTEKEALEDGETEKDYITTIKIEWEE
jgi:hypothetical protein